MKRLIAGTLAMSVSLLAQAELLVAPGTKATLTIDYEYTATGSKPDKYDPKDWKVSRKMTLTTQLAADKQQPLPSLHQLDSTQKADIKGKQDKAQSVSKTMAPMANDMMSIVAKCGEDEACITREVQKYGSGMQMTPELKQAGNDIKDLSKEGPPRYQIWKVVTQGGTFAVDETYNATITDAGEGTSSRYTRNETRKGSGLLPPPAKGQSFANNPVFEVDSVRKDISLKLPMPLAQPMVTRTLKSTSPDDKSGTSQMPMGSVMGKFNTLSVAIPAGLNNASGSQTVKGEGTESEGGTYTLKWRLTLQ